MLTVCSLLQSAQTAQLQPDVEREGGGLLVCGSFGGIQKMLFSDALLSARKLHVISNTECFSAKGSQNSVLVEFDK